MLHHMLEAIRTFEEAFSEYKTSGYKIPKNLQSGIEWYNANFMLISLAHTCPMPPIQEITPETYVWAYAAGLIACTHMNYRITTTQ